MVFVFGGGKSGLERMWFGRDVSSYVLSEILSLEGSYGVDVIALLCMWGSEMQEGMSRIGEAHAHATTCDRALIFNS